jgi:hypothetical protein
MCELAVGQGQTEGSAFIMVDTWEALQVCYMNLIAWTWTAGLTACTVRISAYGKGAGPRKTRDQ